MSSEWFKGTWGDLVELKYGKGLKNYKESNEEIPVFGTNGPVGFTSKALCDFPSIIIGRKGAYRGVHFSSVPFWVIDTAYFVVPKKDFNIKWAYYHLLTQDINALDSGSAIPSTSREDFYQLPVNMPPRWIQDEIVNNLDVLNKKINLNSKSSQTLEEMAQAIFKSWFVDFDPVKAKINGEQPEGMDAATASLFPEKLVESEFGLIPEGWEVTNIGKVSECFDKKRIPLSKRQREQKQGSIPYYGATSVMDYVDEAIFDDIYLLIGEDGSVMKDDGTPFIQYIWGPAWVNNHAHVLQGIKSISTEQLMLFFQQTNINAYVTGAVQLKINQRNMNSIPFIKAPKEINERFYDVVAPLYAKIRAIKEENEQLAKLRDTLLPKLLSGEIELGQAQELAEVE
ncbi:restriction endonuclease subunit S [Vibrio fluvialis]|nr:restriction endonuclease subunit S [Vibrio fluvialis]